LGARADEAKAPAELRIGYQKSSLLAIAKQQKLIERRFKESAVRWVEFSHGPPLLEALGAGRLDYGYSGNAPPIFAQAALAPILYVAAQPAHGENVGIVVPQDSALKSLGDLQGKKVAAAKGSSGHDLLVAALESAGLAYTDITPVYLAPADAASAFATGAIDAWSIWDPFLAIAQVVHKARRLPVDVAVARQNAFFLANREFVGKYPRIVAGVNEDLVAAARYTQAHREEAVTLFAAATGVPLEAETLAVSRTDFGVVPVSESIIREQQAVADRFARIKLIPAHINVADLVWNWTPGG
jgi:aliphatic sulfonates family ABC transporter substrate-binding protein